MKTINKLIIHYICEIVVVILLVGISIPLWKTFDKSNMAHIANSYSNMNYLYLNVKRFISDIDSLDEISIVNDTNTLRNYKLIMKIDKKLDTKEIILDNEIKELTSILYKEDENYFYYLIDSGNLVAGSKVYNIEFNNLYDGITYEIIESKNI